MKYTVVVFIGGGFTTRYPDVSVPEYSDGTITFVDREGVRHEVFGAWDLQTYNLEVSKP